MLGQVPDDGRSDRCQRASPDCGEPGLDDTDRHIVFSFFLLGVLRHRRVEMFVGDIDAHRHALDGRSVF